MRRADRDPDLMSSMLRRLVGELVDERPRPYAWHTVVVRPHRKGEDEVVADRRWAVVAGVAAVLSMLVIGLVIVGAPSSPHGASVTPTVTPSVAGTAMPLETAEQLGEGDWVLASELPDDLTFRYAMRNPESRVVRIGTPSDPERLTIRIVVPSEEAGVDSVTVPATPAPAAGDTVDAWRTDRAESTWEAHRSFGAATVSVYGQTADIDDIDVLLAGLVVVPENLLPHAPLDPLGEMTEVATFELDGGTHRFSVQESNGYFCTRTEDPGGGGSAGCGGSRHRLREADDVFVSFAGGGGYTFEAGGSAVRAVDSGVVVERVDRVDVEFIDGTVVSVVPSNATDDFEGLRFWIVAAVVEVGPTPGSVTPVREVRAFDGNGALLDAAVPSEEFG